MSSQRSQSLASRQLMTGISSLYAYIFCLLVSSELTSMPIFGGAMYLCGQVTLLFFSSAVGPAANLVPARIRRWRRVILTVLMLFSLFLIVIYPLSLSSFQLWTVLVVVMAMLARDEMARRVNRMKARGTIRRSWYIVFIASSHLFPALAVLWDFLYNLPSQRALILFAVYVIADVLVGYNQVRDAVNDEQSIPSEADADILAKLQEQLSRAHAMRVYSALTYALVVSLVMTTVVMFTFVMLAGENMLLQMTFAVAASLITREAAEQVVRLWLRWHDRRPNPTYVMLFGLLLWYAGLHSTGISFLNRASSVWNLYICLAETTAGVTLCLIAMNWMEQAMMSVARFTVGNTLSGFQQVRGYQMELARLMGDMLALLVITLILTLSGRAPQDVQQLLAQSHPIVLLPTLITVLVAVICTFRFPLSTRNMDKLDRFLHLRDEGRENKALQSQLEQIALEEHRQPFGTAFAKAIIRLLYPHKIKGRENIILDDENPLVFLCNHGDIYGPTVCAANFPVPMRPWVISQVCTSVEEFEAYFYRYDLQKARLPEKWKKPLAHLVGKLSIWCMRQLEAVPVYRDKPAELIKTFRQSVEAMQAGDNLLIFPENPNAVQKDHGYEHDGLGTLFEGFTMLATVYYRKTKKKLRFMPMYAHKATRTIVFGHEVDYNPMAPDEAQERHRVVEECEKEMRRLMQEQDAEAESRKRK